MKVITECELLNTMAKVVLERMIGYQTDFYHYDIPILEEAKKDDSYVWVVRTTGTHLWKVGDNRGAITLDTLLELYRDDIKGVFDITCKRDVCGSRFTFAERGEF